MPNLIKAPNIKIEGQDYKLSASIQIPQNKKQEIEADNGQRDISTPMLQEQSGKIIKDAQHRAAMIVEQAQQQANTIILNSKTTIMQEFETAKASGFEQGLLSGKQEIQGELSAKLQDLGGALESIQKRENQLIKDYEQEILGLAISIARKIIFAEITTNHQIMINMMNDTIRYFKNYKWIKLYVAGCDEVSQVLTDPGVAQTILRDFQNIEVIVLPNAPTGSCVLETDKEIVDIGVDTQFATLAGEFAKYSEE